VVEVSPKTFIVGLTPVGKPVTGPLAPGDTLADFRNTSFACPPVKNCCWYGDGGGEEGMPARNNPGYRSGQPSKPGC
jgi:hypothetical protein